MVVEVKHGLSGVAAIVRHIKMSTHCSKLSSNGEWSENKGDLHIG